VSALADTSLAPLLSLNRFLANVSLPSEMHPRGTLSLARKFRKNTPATLALELFCPLGDAA